MVAWADEAMIDAVEPQVSVFSLEHGAELIRKQPRGLSIEDSEMDAVKARQSIKRSNPKVSVRCLSNAAYLVFRHTIVDCPDLKAVLSVRRRDQAEENCQVGKKS